MTPHKYRVWSPAQQQMTYFTLDQLLASYGHETNTIDSLLWDVRAEEVMDSTGLRDIHHKEIYAGDIVQWNGAGRVHTQIVRWEKEDAQFFPNSMNEDAWIVGNIYEHPALARDVTGS